MSAGSRGAVWTMLVLPPALLAVLIFGYAAVTGLAPSDPAAEAAIRAALPAILAVNHLSLFGLLILLLRRRGESLGDIGWSLRGSDTTVALEVAVGLACAVGLYLLKELAVDPVRQLVAGQTPTFTSLFAFRPASMELGMALAGAGLVFVEESIYRGFALPFLRALRGTVPAVLLTSVAFGLLHWGNGPGAVLFATVWGVLLAGIFLWRRNLVAGTAAHALYNLAVLLT